MREQMREYVRIMAGNTELLRAVRDREIREADPAKSIEMFAEAFRVAIRELPPRQDSGLVEWQKAMPEWRRRG
jgi:hypothetical protein